VKNIKVSDSEAALLREFYVAELAKAQQEVGRLQGVIKQLGGAKAKGKRGRPKGSTNKKRSAGRRSPGRPKGATSKRRSTGKRGRPKGSTKKVTAKAAT